MYLLVSMLIFQQLIFTLEDYENKKQYKYQMQVFVMINTEITKDRVGG